MGFDDRAKGLTVQSELSEIMVDAERAGWLALGLNVWLAGALVGSRSLH